MKRAPVTWSLVGVLIAVFTAEVAAGKIGDERALVSWGALITRGWSNTDWWRIATFSLLHANFLHIAINSAGLIWLGRLLERRIGSRPMLAIFAATAVVSGLAAMVLGPLLPTTGVAIGASGAVCGLLAAALVIAFRTEKDRRLRVPRIAATAIIAAISFVPGVSLSGHIGGFIGGLVVAMLR